MSDHDHPHDHAHDHSHGHGHPHRIVDPSIATSGRGLWAIKWSFAGLAVTAALQLVVVVISGSVALLADKFIISATPRPRSAGGRILVRAQEAERTLYLRLWARRAWPGSPSY